MEQAVVKRIAITNFKGIASIAFEPKTVTVISGGNGAGKTSLLDGLKVTFEGGHDPDMIHQGADKAEITLETDDGLTIRRLITPKTSTITVKSEDGRKVSAPATFVKTLASGMSFDPLALMDAKKEDRAKFLMESMPVTFAADEIREAGVPGVTSQRTEVDLQYVNELIDGIKDTRRDLNRSARDLEGTVSQLERSLPEEGEGDGLKEKAEDLERELNEKRSAIERAGEDRDAWFNEQRSEKQRVFNEAVQKLKDDLEADVEALRQTAVEVYEESVSEYRTRVEDLKGELGSIREKVAAADRAAGAREQVAKLRKDWQAKTEKSENLTAQLKALEDLKKLKLSQLPIEGIDIAPDGDILIDGIPWDHVNTAERMIVVVQLASMAVGKLGFIICDKAEHFEDSKFQDFVEAFRDTDLQLVVARRTKGELTVETL